MISIKRYDPAFAAQVTDIFYSAVHSIDDKIYSPAQKKAWAPLPIDYESWSSRLQGKQPFLAFHGQNLSGFIELEDDGHIDCMYVAPQYQRLGIGNALFLHLYKQAQSRKMAKLSVDASHLARPFFEKHGFAVDKENKVQLRGEVLVNFSMSRSLAKNRSS